MLVPQKYSERLGVIDPDQLHEAARRLGLGDVTGAYVPGGSVLGQNLVLETSTGEVVLRGNPYGLAQLTKERRVAELIDSLSGLPAPWPYRICEDTDVFGWPFAVVPLLGGTSGAELLLTCDDEGKLELARATGDALAELHEVESEFFGPYDAQLDDFIEMDDFADWFLYRLEHWRNACRAVGAMSTEAELYVDELIDECADALDEPFTPVLVHHDFESANLNFEHTPHGFEAAGVFGLAEAYFGDGEEDLVRMLRRAESDAQRAAFIDAYTSVWPLREGAGERLALYALADWMVAWERACRLGTLSAEDASFVASARPIADRAREAAR